MAKKRKPVQKPDVRDCSKLIHSWLDEFRGGMADKPEWLEARRPIFAENPITCWVGPDHKHWSHAPEEMFFVVKSRLVPDKKNRWPKLKAGSLKEVVARNYFPTWILEYILQSLYANTGQEHMLRPGAESDLPIELPDDFTLEEVTLYIYMIYQNMKEAENVEYLASKLPDYDGPVRSPRVYGHWTIFPTLLNDYTHVYVLDEIRRRVKGNVRRFVLQHAIRLRRTERKFYDWVQRHGAMEILAAKDQDTTSDLAVGLKAFVEECEVYDRSK